jgi:hypothetical protein
MRWLLAEVGVYINGVSISGRTVWTVVKYEHADAAELSSLLKVMVMLDDAPADFITSLLPQLSEIASSYGVGITGLSCLYDWSSNGPLLLPTVLCLPCCCLSSRHMP